MCETCNHSYLIVNAKQQQNLKAYDPTHTTGLRNAFGKALNKRFDDLVKLIKTAVVEEDCFGLVKPTSLITFAEDIIENVCIFQVNGGPGSGIKGHRTAKKKTEKKGLGEFVSKRSYWSQQKLDEGDLKKAGFQDITTAMPKVSKRDYFLSTKGSFSVVPKSEWDGLDVDIFKSDSGSAYKIKSGVLYRRANHWGKVGTCEWSINSNHYYRHPFYYYKDKQGKEKWLGKDEPILVGKIKIKDLKRINTALIRNELQVNQEIGHKAFQYSTSQEKVEQFMEWLNGQVDKGLLETTKINQLGAGANQAWTNVYIKDSYKRGVIRARSELKKAGFKNIPGMEQTGGIEMSMTTPFHIDRLGLVYSRTYTDLKGITTAMDSQISRILAQGLADGDGPSFLAKKMIHAIDGSGAGTLGQAVKYTNKSGNQVEYFMPAKRRAEIWARTEVIRTHHAATIQEYSNWGAEGVNVEAEFTTAGDGRVCSICAGLQGKIYTLTEAEGLIPVHPQCFIDPQTPVYTSEGWKPIGNVVVGDKVLTHKKRFKKVYALPRSKGQEGTEVITFKFVGGQTVSLTSNHLVLVSTKGNTFSRWKEAGKCTVNDSIMYLANECKRCNELVPYYRTYCSRTCLSKDITDKQWADPKHRENVSKKNSLSNIRQYKSGERDRFATTKAANNKTRAMVKDGTYGTWMDEAFHAKNNERSHTPELRERTSKRMKANNPMNDPEVVKKAQASMQISYLADSKNRLNNKLAIMRWEGKMTWIEQQMADLLDRLGIEYMSQYPILKYRVDFVIPALKIAIECDGEYWHKDKAKDEARQKEIENEGWFVLRYTGAKINSCIEEIGTELIRVVYNHTGQYQTTALSIESIKRWKLKRQRPLYNLSVEEDESYIAKGMVVHNCRCIALPTLPDATVVEVPPVEKVVEEKITSKTSLVEDWNIIKNLKFEDDRLDIVSDVVKFERAKPTLKIINENPNEIVNARFNMDLDFNIQGVWKKDNTERIFSAGNAKLTGSYNSDTKVLSLTNIYVDDKFRGKGIATFMNKKARSLLPEGYSIQGSGVYSPAGKALSAKLEKQGILTKI